MTADYKIFTFGETKVGIGVMETTHPAYAMERKQEILETMQLVKEKTELDALLFCVVDILQEENTCLVLESDQELMRRVFGCDIIDNQGSLGNVLSRKKQIVPAFEKYFG